MTYGGYGTSRRDAVTAASRRGGCGGGNGARAGGTANNERTKVDFRSSCENIARTTTLDNSFVLPAWISTTWRVDDLYAAWRTTVGIRRRVPPNHRPTVMSDREQRSRGFPRAIHASLSPARTLWTLSIKQHWRVCNTHSVDRVDDVFGKRNGRYSHPHKHTHTNVFKNIKYYCTGEEYLFRNF